MRQPSVDLECGGGLHEHGRHGEGRQWWRRTPLAKPARTRRAHRVWSQLQIAQDDAILDTRRR